MSDVAVHYNLKITFEDWLPWFKRGSIMAINLALLHTFLTEYVNPILLG